MKIRLLFSEKHAAGTLLLRRGTLLSSGAIPENCTEFTAEADGADLDAGSCASLMTADLPPFPFTFFLRDVTSECPVYVPEARCAVVPGTDPRTFDEVVRDIQAARLQSDFQRMEAEPEESYENACRENRDQVCPVWLGLGKDLRIFRVDAQEDCQMWGRIRPVFHSKFQYSCFPEDNAMFIREILFHIGPGAHCCPKLTRRLDEGVLPILHAVQDEQEVKYVLTLFASLEKGPVAPERVRGSEPMAALSQMNYCMMTPEERKQTAQIIPAETCRREEELVLFLHVEAVNTGKTPEYAWFKAPYTRKGRLFRNGMCWEEGKIFASVQLNGKLAEDSELAVLVQPGRAAVWECRIFHSPVEPERAEKFLEQDYQAHLDALRTYWKGKLAQGAKIRVPEKAVDERIRAGLLHLDVNTIGLAEKGPLLPAVGYYSPIGTESAPMIQFFDTMGWHRQAERCIDFFLGRQKANGFIQVYNNYESETGPVLWTAGEHFRMTRDAAWLRRVTPALEKSCEYLLAWREKNKREEFRAMGGYGLLNGKVADPDDFYHSFFLNAGTLLGLEAMAEVLVHSDPGYAEKLAKELVLYRQDLRNALEYSRKRAPVFPLKDGTWTPILPPWTEYSGSIALYADGGEWFSHGAFASRSSLTGALYFALSGLYAPDSSMMDTLLKSDQHPVTRKNAALSQPYYSRHDVAHLRRGEVKLFLKAFYNQFAALQDRQSYTFWEHYYHLSQHKTHEEGWFLMQCRWMLAYEEGERLELFRCIPRKWLENGKKIEITGLVTRFGKLNARIISYGDRFDVTAEAERMPESVEIRIPHPDGRKAVKISCGAYDAASETVTFRGERNICFTAEF